MNLAEQVAGRKRQIRFQVHLTEAELAPFILDSSVGIIVRRLKPSDGEGVRAIFETAPQFHSGERRGRQDQMNNNRLRGATAGNRGI